MATRERCTNYNNEEGHEYLNEWQLWLCNSIWFSFQVYREVIIMFDFRKKETKAQRNNLPMVIQASNWKDGLKKPRGSWISKSCFPHHKAVLTSGPTEVNITLSLSALCALYVSVQTIRRVNSMMKSPFYDEVY